MAELATIARPYAEALFKTATSDLGGTAVWLDALAAIASNVQLQAYAGNPSVTAAQTFEVISGVAESQKTPLPESAKNFLRAVIDNGRISVLPEIASQFRALKNAQSGSSDAVVYSAFALDDAAMKSNGRCAAATSGPLADTAASARSDAHLSSSCLQRHAVMQD